MTQSGKRENLHQRLPYELLEQHPAIIKSLVALLAIAILIIDAALPLGIAAGTAYGLVVLATIATHENIDTYIAGFVSVVLTGVGYYLSPPTVNTIETVITNRVLAVAIILGAMVMVLQRKKYVKQVAFLTTLSLTDSLTGLYNRYAFEKVVRREIVRAHRYNLALSLAILDLDHFKQINDSLGHDAGDAILTDVSKLINAHIRESDTLFRFGGDEFAILYTNSNQSQAENSAQHCCDSVLSLSLEKGIKFSLSIGIAELEESDQVEHLFRKADQALYQAKKAGRNQVVLSSAVGKK